MTPIWNRQGEHYSLLQEAFVKSKKEIIFELKLGIKWIQNQQQCTENPKLKLREYFEDYLNLVSMSR